MRALIIQGALGFLGGLSACFLGFALVKPPAFPQFATVDMVALTKPRLESLAQANLSEQAKIADMLAFEKELTGHLTDFAIQHHLILLNKPAVIASSIAIEDITEPLSKLLPPNTNERKDSKQGARA